MANKILGHPPPPSPPKSRKTNNKNDFFLVFWCKILNKAHFFVHDTAQKPGWPSGLPSWLMRVRACVLLRSFVSFLLSNAEERVKQSARFSLLRPDPLWCALRRHYQSFVSRKDTNETGLTHRHVFFITFRGSNGMSRIFYWKTLSVKRLSCQFLSLFPFVLGQ